MNVVRACVRMDTFIFVSNFPYLFLVLKYELNLLNPLIVLACDNVFVRPFLCLFIFYFYFF